MTSFFGLVIIVVVTVTVAVGFTNVDDLIRIGLSIEVGDVLETELEEHLVDQLVVVLHHLTESRAVYVVFLFAFSLLLFAEAAREK